VWLLRPRNLQRRNRKCLSRGELWKLQTHNRILKICRRNYGAYQRAREIAGQDHGGRGQAAHAGIAGRSQLKRSREFLLRTRVGPSSREKTGRRPHLRSKMKNPFRARCGRRSLPWTICRRPFRPPENSSQAGTVGSVSPYSESPCRQFA